MPPCTVIPELVYDDVGEAVRWLCDTFGFAVRWQAGDHRAQLSYGAGTVVVTEPRTSRALPGLQSVMVRVDDADAHHARARDRGARILAAPRDFPYGERQYSVEDPAGHHWDFSQSIADRRPEEWGGTSGPALGGPPHISVMLIVPDGDAAVDWYKRALGATELWNLGGVAGLEVHGAPFFVHEVNPDNPRESSPDQVGQTSTRIELFAEDPDALLAAALSAGATLGAPMTDHERPGARHHRQGGFVDPFGHVWSVGDRSPLGRATG